MLIEELIEKAFSDGYEYAQREFGKKKEDDLTSVDKADLFLYKNLSTKRGREYNRNVLKGKDDKYAAKMAGGLMAGVAGIGSYATAKKAGLSGGKSALIGAAAGALMGGAEYGAVRLGTKSGLKTVKELKKRDKSYKRNADKQLDLIDLAEGKISKEEFIKKHYKK